MNHEANTMVDFCLSKGLTLHASPGPCRSVQADSAHRITTCRWRDRAAAARPLQPQPTAMQGSGPARCFQIDDSDLRVGFITRSLSISATPAARPAERQR